MKKIVLGVLLFMFVFVEAALCIEVGGVILPDTLKAGDTELLINGHGVRTKFAFKVYSTGLYLKAKETDAQKILNADEPMALIMHWRRSVPADKIQSVFYESFAQVLNAPEQDAYNENSDYGPLTKQVVQFMKAVADKKVTNDISCRYLYIPGKGTEVHIYEGDKGELKTVIPGIEFKKAMLSIWIGEDPPVGNGLKDELLGK